MYIYTIHFNVIQAATLVLSLWFQQGTGKACIWHSSRQIQKNQDKTSGLRYQVLPSKDNAPNFDLQLQGEDDHQMLKAATDALK